MVIHLYHRSDKVKLCFIRNKVRFFQSDDIVSVGTGKGSHSFDVNKIPDPEEIDWKEVSDIPVILITGTNGKSTILSAAEITNVDAIHPGYGFLAENAEFSQICYENELTFIGPSAEIINSMGDKASAKKTMKAAGVPVIPGSEGTLGNVEEARVLAEEMSYPVMLKATAGGGGRGIRLVRELSQLENAYSTASNEALKGFNNGDLYLEKFVENPRHVEIQIVADQFGNVIHLGERDCSIQRRHQKLVEESPSPAVDDALRKRMGDAAIKGAKSIDYVGLGTVEFLLAEDGQFYFMEMNTRIQVEHPVTEAVVGKDLVKMQINMHSGETFPEFLKDVKLRGHSIECRINAEDPDNNFITSPGLVESFHVPGGMGVRVDTHVYAGYNIPSQYDSLLAKIIVHADDRPSAINRMQRALEETIIEGPKTTIAFQQAIMRNEDFRKGDYTTGFLDTFDYQPKNGKE